MNKIAALSCLLFSCVVCQAMDAEKRERSISVSAEVTNYKIAAQVDHFDDGSVCVFDLVHFKIVTPMDFSDRPLQVLLHSQRLPVNSPLRKAKTRCTFRLSVASLTQKQLYWGQIEQLRVLPPQGE